jgi:hypothetical protein
MTTPPYTRIVTVLNPKTGVPVQLGITGYDIDKGWSVVNIETGKHGYVRSGIDDGASATEYEKEKIIFTGCCGNENH